MAETLRCGAMKNRFPRSGQPAGRRARIAWTQEEAKATGN